MSLIRRVVQKTLRSGCLTTETEDYLKQLFHNRCELEDIEALTELQQALSSGNVKRLSRQEMEAYLADLCDRC